MNIDMKLTKEEFEQLKISEEIAKKLLNETMKKIEKAINSNEFLQGISNQLEEKLKNKGIDVTNLKADLLNKVDVANKGLDNSFSKIQFQVLVATKRIADVNIVQKYEKLKLAYDNISNEDTGEINKKLEILNSKAEIIKEGVDKSKDLRNSALTLKESHESRKKELEEKIVAKGEDPSNLETAIKDRYNKQIEALNGVVGLLPLDILAKGNKDNADLIKQWESITKSVKILETENKDELF